MSSSPVVVPYVMNPGSPDAVTVSFLILCVMSSPKFSVFVDVYEMMSPSLRVLGSTSFTKIRSPAAKSVAFMESEFTMNIFLPKRERLFLSSVVAEMIVNIIIATAAATTSHVTTFFMIFRTFSLSV